MTSVLFVSDIGLSSVPSRRNRKTAQNIKARPTTLWVRGYKWSKRRPIAALSVAAGVLLLIGLTGGVIIWQRVRDQFEGLVIGVGLEIFLGGHEQSLALALRDRGFIVANFDT